jgi:uncharacterized protein YneF (UPF0154 family)
MLETSQITQQLIQAIVKIIGRKTSEDYASVVVRTIVKKLQQSYAFLQYVDVKNTHFLETEESVTVDASLNDIDPKEVGNALKDLIRMIMKSMGKGAGYFFIKEVKEKLGIDYNTALIKTMDVDLAMMQSSYIVDRRSIDLLHVEPADVMRRVLKILLDLVEKQTTRAFAIVTVAKQIQMLKQQYEFLRFVTVNDVHITLGSDEVVVQGEINNAEPLKLGKAIELILTNVDNSLEGLGRTPIADGLKTRLTTEYLSKLEGMRVNLAVRHVGYNTIFKQVLKALVDVLGRASTEDYAIFAVNLFLRKTDSTYEFLKYMKVNPATYQGDIYQITIMNDLKNVSETDARRALQRLLASIVDSLGEKQGDQFIHEFKNSLEKRYLSRIEEMGVNLHMIELHQELLTRMEPKVP